MSSGNPVASEEAEVVTVDYHELLLTELGAVGFSPRSGSLPEQVADYLDKFISRHDVPSGALLGTKSALAQAFGIAPSTLSESMKFLVGRGRVRLRQGPKGGVFVTQSGPVLRLAHSLVQLSDDAVAVEDAADVRDALESVVAHNALRSRSQVHVDALYRLQDAIEESTDSTSLYHNVLALHAAIAEACSNEFLKAVYLTALRTVQSHAQALVLDSTDSASAKRLRASRHAVHRSIVEAIDNQDVPALDRALRKHSAYRRSTRVSSS